MARIKDSEIRARGVLAAERYLERRGLEVLENRGPRDDVSLVCDDLGVLVFVNVRTSTEKMPDVATSDIIADCEEFAADWLRGAPEKYVDSRVRFDVVGLHFLGADRALIKHHVNAFGGSPC